MMKLRTILAVTAGLLVATGYALNGGPPWIGPRMVLAMIFGFSISWSWLNDPERSLGRGSAIITRILLAVAILYATWKEPFLKAALVTLFCLAFAGIQLAMARLYQKERRELAE
jgi:peptidoglycan/LPS O-acetylase OafA/YrhL